MSRHSRALAGLTLAIAIAVGGLVLTRQMIAVAGEADAERLNRSILQYVALKNPQAPIKAFLRFPEVLVAESQKSNLDHCLVLAQAEVESTFKHDAVGAAGEIGLFRILSETGVAAGVRRIEAQTGVGALSALKRLEADVRELSDILKVAPSDLVGRTKKLAAQLKEKERELEELKLKLASGASNDAEVRTIGSVQVHVQRTDGMDMTGMRALADRVRDKLKSGVVALGGVSDDKVSLLVAVTKDLTATIKAGDLIKSMAVEVGGTGGGRPELAQAGGKQPEGLPRALEKVFPLVEKALGQ